MLVGQEQVIDVLRKCLRSDPRIRQNVGVKPGSLIRTLGEPRVSHDFKSARFRQGTSLTIIRDAHSSGAFLTIGLLNWTLVKVGMRVSTQTACFVFFELLSSVNLRRLKSKTDGGRGRRPLRRSECAVLRIKRKRRNESGALPTTVCALG